MDETTNISLERGRKPPLSLPPVDFPTHGLAEFVYLKFIFFLLTKCVFRKFEYTPTMHTHQETRGYRICLGTYAKACESRLWSHTSSSEGWSIRRALGLGSCGRDGRAYLIDPPQFLATSEFLRLQAAYMLWRWAHVRVHIHAHTEMVRHRNTDIKK